MFFSISSTCSLIFGTMPDRARKNGPVTNDKNPIWLEAKLYFYRSHIIDTSKPRAFSWSP